MWRTGVVQKAVVATTFALTMIVPLQFAVLVGVGLAVVLHVVAPVEPGDAQAVAARCGRGT